MRALLILIVILVAGHFIWVEVGADGMTEECSAETADAELCSCVKGKIRFSIVMEQSLWDAEGATAAANEMLGQCRAEAGSGT